MSGRRCFARTRLKKKNINATSFFLTLWLIACHLPQTQCVRRTIRRVYDVAPLRQDEKDDTIISDFNSDDLLTYSTQTSFKAYLYETNPFEKPTPPKKKHHHKHKHRHGKDFASYFDVRTDDTVYDDMYGEVLNVYTEEENDEKSIEELEEFVRNVEEEQRQDIVELTTPFYISNKTRKYDIPLLRELMMIPPDSTILDLPWPVKKEAVVEGDVNLGGLMMVHSREDDVTCGPIMPQGGIQALEAMLFTLDYLNKKVKLIPNVTIGAHILDDCDKDTYGLEMAVDFIKGKFLILIKTHV